MAAGVAAAVQQDSAQAEYRVRRAAHETASPHCSRAHAAPHPIHPTHRSAGTPRQHAAPPAAPPAAPRESNHEEEEEAARAHHHRRHQEGAGGRRRRCVPQAVEAGGLSAAAKAVEAEADLVQTLLHPHSLVGGEADPMGQPHARRFGQGEVPHCDQGVVAGGAGQGRRPRGVEVGCSRRLAAAHGVAPAAWAMGRVEEDHARYAGGGAADDPNPRQLRQGSRRRRRHRRRQAGLLLRVGPADLEDRDRHHA